MTWLVTGKNHKPYRNRDQKRGKRIQLVLKTENRNRKKSIPVFKSEI